MSLSERIRPNCEAAPWVIDEVKRLEFELAEAYAELRKQRPTIKAVFDRVVWERAKNANPNAPPFEGTLDHECGIYPPDGESGPVAIASGKNDARRIVACVNACAGVTTEELEQGGFVAGLVERLEDAPRWRDVVDELPQEAQEVLFVRGGKTVHGAWIGGIFWHSNQKMAAATWMPLPKPPKVGAGDTAALGHNAGVTGA